VSGAFVLLREVLGVLSVETAVRGRWAAWTEIVRGCLSVVISIAVWIYFHQHPYQGAPS